MHGVNMGPNGPVNQIAYNLPGYSMSETDGGVVFMNPGGYVFFVPFSNINSIQYDKADEGGAP